MICSIITYWSRDHDGKKDGLLQQHKGKNSVYFAGIISNTGSTQPQNELFLQEKRLICHQLHLSPVVWANRNSKLRLDKIK